MTQDEALKLAFGWYGSGSQDPDEFEKLIKAIVAQPKQEPVEPTEKIYKAWEILVGQHKDLLEENKKLRNQLQRTWVGLTDEEFHEACWESYVDPVTGECWTGDREYAVRWTEAKLKEKNT
jgi:hypothetical protein